MLTDVLFKDRVNDLTFIVAEKLVKFHEQQSSINENIPLRFHIYSGRTYEKLFDNKLLYRENRIAVPTPEFFVLYNGVNPFPEKKTYRLSDAFASPPENGLSLELVVTAYNINKGYNEAIVGKDEYLHGYVTFCAMVRENEQRGASREKAVKTAIEECIRLGILAEYLQSNASDDNSKHKLKNICKQSVNKKATQRPSLIAGAVFVYALSIALFTGRWLLVVCRM